MEEQQKIIEEQKKRQRCIFDYVKKVDLLPSIESKKAKLQNEIFVLNNELKDFSTTVELLNMADDFCELIRDALYQKLGPIKSAWNYDPDDDDQYEDGDRNIEVFSVALTSENTSKLEFQGQYAELAKAFMTYSGGGGYKDLFDYFQKQFNLIVDDMKEMYPMIICPKLFFSQLQEEIFIPFHRYVVKGVCVKFYYREF